MHISSTPLFLRTCVFRHSGTIGSKFVRTHRPLDWSPATIYQSWINYAAEKNNLFKTENIDNGVRLYVRRKPVK